MRLTALRGIARALIPLIALFALAAGLAACSGSTGPAGPAGSTGATGGTGPAGPPGPGADAVASTKPESCDTCHPAVGSQNHQAIYNQYTDTSTLVMKFTGLASTAVAPVAPVTVTTYDVTLTFTITNNSLPYVDAAGLPSLLQKTFYGVQYNSATRQFLNSIGMSASKSSSTCKIDPTTLPATVCSAGVVPSATAGTYTLLVHGFTYDPTASAAPFDGAEVYGYIAKDQLNVESTHPGSNYKLYANMSSAALAFGTAQAANASAYVSNADVTACQGCHGTPYRKHGYREAIVGNGTPATPVLPTFAACKTCHYDNKVGGDMGWQVMVDDPLSWATVFFSSTSPLPAGATAYPAKYNYTANIMSDVHMSHAMEFAYPQSMANCATCHTGPDVAGTKLNNVRVDAFFTGATCRSCHPVADHSSDTPIAYPTQTGRAPSLQALWKQADVKLGGTAIFNSHNGMDLSNGSTATDCTVCHSAAAGTAPTFAQEHTGYDASIYADPTTGTKYNSRYGAQIDSATLTGTCSASSTSGCVLDIIAEPTFNAQVGGDATTAGTIVPTIAVSFYGYDTKDFLISRHTADGRTPTANCPSRTGAPGGCSMEWSPGSKNPLFTPVVRTDGKWEVQLDVAAWVPPANTTGTIPAEIAAGRLKKAEITVQPALTANGTVVALDAPSQTIDVTAPGATTGTQRFVANYFQGTNALVDVTKCNKCHDALGPTFHGGQYGGNVVLCRSCHVPTAGGAHLEVQSRSLDGYVHAIHSFQVFDTASIQFTVPKTATTLATFDPVAAKRYSAYIEHTFPNFTTKNCEGCHVTSSFSSGKTSDPAPTYEVPDQSQTIPGLLSASDALKYGWFGLDANGNPTAAADRNISGVNSLGVPFGSVPSYVTGPASRACGGCHRARLINDDDAGGLASFNQHTGMMGYLVDTSQTSTTWTSATAYLYGVISNIMSFFN
jgi:hypothetical protein